MINARIAITALSLGLLAGSSASAATLLNDSFNDGNLGTNTTGIGSGFAPAEGLYYGSDYQHVSAADSTGSPYDVRYTEANGAATIDGPHVAWQIQSKDTFDPTNTKLTWNVLKSPDPRVGTTDNGVTVGYAQAGALNFPVALEMRQDRLVFDFMAGDPWDYSAGRYLAIAAGSTATDAVYGGATDGMIASIDLRSNSWQIDVVGTGIDVHQTGAYSLGHSLSDPLAAYGPLSTFAAMGEGSSHERVTASFGSVSLVTVPEPSTLALVGSAAFFALTRRRNRRTTR